jgi:hypothetical protein
MKKMDSNDTITRRVGLCRAIRDSSFVILFGLFCLLPAANSFAQSSNRWLLVFNTSASMRDRVKGMETVTYDLLTTAMHGTLRAGDTIGIWTYNNELHAEEAPLQKWTPSAAPEISKNTLQFIDKHSYEKTAAFSDVLTNMLRVISISEVITVILISDGTDSITGTPFDSQIASFYKTNSSKQKKAHMPVVTIFRGEKGVITTNTLALTPWPVDIPMVPVPPVSQTVVQKPPPVAPAKPVPSLVIIGKKAETTFNPPTDSPEHAGEPAPQPPIIPQQTEPAPVTAKVETPSTPTPESAPASKVEEKSSTVTAPVLAAVTPAATAPASTPATTPVETKPVQPVEPMVAAAAVSNAPVAKAATPQTETAAVVPEKNLFSARNIAIVSVAFTVLVCGLLILSARNARRTARASLITRSLDRERK